MALCDPLAQNANAGGGAAEVGVAERHVAPHVAGAAAVFAGRRLIRRRAVLPPRHGGRVRRWFACGRSGCLQEVFQPFHSWALPASTAQECARCSASSCGCSRPPHGTPLRSIPADRDVPPRRARPSAAAAPTRCSPRTTRRRRTAPGRPAAAHRPLPRRRRTALAPLQAVAPAPY